MARKPAAAPRTATLLVEILTEELPPRSLETLARAFRDSLTHALESAGLRTSESGSRYFATPRRLAVAVSHVRAAAGETRDRVLGPSAKAPAEAVAGFARKHGATVEQLARVETPKGPVYALERTLPGAVLAEVLAAKVETALKALPVTKLMRWGAGEAQFVRPVHGLVMLYGAKLMAGTVLGVESARHTRGHRFMGKSRIALKNADSYEAQLRDEGLVLADFGARRSEIERQLQHKAKQSKASLGDTGSLLDEVTALVEHPTVYVGQFDPAYLAVPQECLILTMRQNQKYFPLFDAAGKLLPRFLIVSNMQLADPRHVVGGNERVVRPRLEDARFFYDQDRKQRLEERVPQLARVVFHHKLGSQADRMQGTKLLAGMVARRLVAADEPAERVATLAALAERAAELSKADLLTGMVGEFPELQGIMGRYYALHDGEPPEVADAIEAHYRPRFAGDRLPESLVACAVALADKLYLLAGFFGIGQQPTGEKDPYGLRRAALGVIRILVERAFPVQLNDLVSAAYRALPKDIGQAQTDVIGFILERLRGYLAERGYAALEIDAVLSRAFVRLDQVPKQLDAVRAFSQLPEAPSLAAANKRIANILKQAGSVPAEFDPALFTEAEEKQLASAFATLQPGFESAFRAGDYTGALRGLAALKAPVDAFFDKVLVMDKDERVRQNRIGFLGKLHATMNRIADLFEARSVKLVVLDRDGTINHDSDQYIKSPAEWKPIKGSLEAIARLTQAGFRVVVATNQSGIGRGLFDMATLNAIHDAMHRAVHQAGGRIDAIFFCPHRDEDHCECRKPKPGMLYEIAKRLNVDLEGVPVVGDSLRDLQAAAAAGAKPVLVLTGKGRKTREAGGLPQGTAVYPDLAAFAAQQAP